MFCIPWYNDYVFESPLARNGPDPWQGPTDQTWLESRAAQPGLVLDKARYGEELTALRLELFGAAFTHRILDKERRITAQATATKAHLRDRGLLGLWERMLPYNPPDCIWRGADHPDLLGDREQRQQAARRPARDRRGHLRRRVEHHGPRVRRSGTQ